MSARARTGRPGKWCPCRPTTPAPTAPGCTSRPSASTGPRASPPSATATPRSTSPRTAAATTTSRWSTARCWTCTAATSCATTCARPTGRLPTACRCTAISCGASSTTTSGKTATSARFGIVHCDYRTQLRTPKLSARYYARRHPRAPHPVNTTTLHLAAVVPAADRLPLKQKIGFGLGAILDMWGHWLYPSLAYQVLPTSS